jgi:hypothetical protein
VTAVQLVCFEGIRFCMVVLVRRFPVWFDDVKSYSCYHNRSSVSSCVLKRVDIGFFWHIRPCLMSMYLLVFDPDACCCGLVWKSILESKFSYFFLSGPFYFSLITRPICSNPVAFSWTAAHSASAGRRCFLKTATRCHGKK